jgi:hypothetical protein
MANRTWRCKHCFSLNFVEVCVGCGRKRQGADLRRETALIVAQRLIDAGLDDGQVAKFIKHEIDMTKAEAELVVLNMKQKNEMAS